MGVGLFMDTNTPTPVTAATATDMTMVFLHGHAGFLGSLISVMVSALGFQVWAANECRGVDFCLGIFNDNTLQAWAISEGILTDFFHGFRYHDGFDAGAIESVRSLKEIGAHAFYGTGIESIVIPETVEKVDMDAFAYCPRLKSFVIENPATKVHPSAFSGCPMLKTQ